jgi:hypothetical protein
MNKEQLGSLRMAIGKVQALIKAMELSQRGLGTEQSNEVAMCAQAAHQLLESVYQELSRAQKSAEVFQIPTRRRFR